MKFFFHILPKKKIIVIMKKIIDVIIRQESIHNTTNIGSHTCIGGSSNYKYFFHLGFISEEKILLVTN